MWVEVEESLEPWCLIAGVGGLGYGVLVGWQLDFCAGAVAYLAGGFTILIARQLWLQLRLPADARRAANRVLTWFREQFPDERVESVAVRAVESARFVIAVRYGMGRPTPRRYFMVARPDSGAIAELPVRDWWPRGLK